MYTVKQLVDSCHQLAPPHLAESYDNVGLLIGNATDRVDKVLCALDLNEEVIKEAIDNKAQCIITHHPFLFKSIKKIDTTTAQGKIIKELIKNDINLIAMHTNLDIVEGGINDFLANKLNIKQIKPLKITAIEPMYKVSVCVPITHEETVRQALIQWNQTTVGNYSGCTFTTKGVGTFIPQEGSNPTIGKLHHLEKVDEVKIEVVIEANKLQGLLQLLKSVHPYEEIAYDVYCLEHMNTVRGVGRWGHVDQISLQELIKNVKVTFGIPYVRVTGQTDKMIEKIAVCSGSGSSFINEAAAVADVYITGDMTFHEAQSASNEGLIVLDVGHYASENIAIPLIKDYLAKNLKNIEVICSQVDAEMFKIY